MDILLANKIIEEIRKFSEIKCAITNDLGTVLAKSVNFEIGHPQLDIKSTKALKIKYDQKGYGFVYLDESTQVRKEIGGVIKSMVELIIQQNRHTLILSNDEKRIDQITYDYLYTDSISPSDYANILSSFGLDLQLQRTAILVEICDPSYLRLYEREIIEGERERIIATVKRGIETSLSGFYTQHTQNIIFYLGGANFLILKDMGKNPAEYEEEFKKTLHNLLFNLESELRTKITVGVGEYKKGIEGIKESYTEARTALKFGEQTWGTDKIYHYAPLFGGANRENINFSKDIVKKISEHHDLQNTLECYLDSDLSLTRTARTLKIHRNTLVYRLGKVEEITGLDPKSFNDAFQLRIALILDKYHA
jgi:carbohydrate diacid regulator